MGDGADDAGYLQRRFDQVADQPIDGMDPVGPPAGAFPHRQTLIDLALLPDGETDPVELVGRLRELLRDVVEGFRDAPGIPVWSRGSRTAKSPFLRARKGPRIGLTSRRASADAVELLASMTPEMKR